MIKTVSGISIPIEKDEHFFEICCIKAGFKKEQVKHFKIIKKSIDARNKSRILFNYSIEIGSVKEQEPPFIIPNVSSALRPVIVGSGPCGLFAAYILSSAGLRPIVLERGSRADIRKAKVENFLQGGDLDTECNIQFGEGGAGTFSDGKLNTQTKSPFISEVLKVFASCGAPSEILYLNKAHIGTDILIDVTVNLRKKIIELGGEFLFDTKLIGIAVSGGKVVAAEHTSGAIETDTVILATGHSARDTFKMLNDSDINMSAKAFAVGVRIEHRREMIDTAQYGGAENIKILGAADYKLACSAKGRSAYTFCMCPGGYVVPAASEEGMLVTNGMSLHARNAENSNSALLVNVTPDDYGGESSLSGIDFQRSLERAAYLAGGGGYSAPYCTAGEFLSGKLNGKLGGVMPSYRRGVKNYPLWDILPEFVTATLRDALTQFDRKIKGFSSSDAVLTAIESRSSSPVKIARGENYQTNIKGVYSAGEGGGHAGGIISAATDGIKSALAVINNQ